MDTQLQPTTFCPTDIGIPVLPLQPHQGSTALKTLDGYCAGAKNDLSKRANGQDRVCNPTRISIEINNNNTPKFRTVQMIAERDVDSAAVTPSPLTQHHHLSLRELLEKRQRECAGNSSSDENRSSGRASMSDTDRHSVRDESPQQSPLHLASEEKKFTNRNRIGVNRNRPRPTPAKLPVPWSGSGLEDIKLAMQQLTMRSHTSTSTYSSLSGSESSSADEFVWVDSHNRLVELRQLPWSHRDLQRVLQNGRTREHMERVPTDAIPRLSYLLQRALVRIARETQRLAKPLGLCSKHEVLGALKIVLCPALADSCTKACLRAAVMFATSGDQLRQSKASRSGLQLPVGRFLRWMSDIKLGRMVHEYAAVYLAAGIENLLEEILLQCVSSDSSNNNLTATTLEHAISNSGDLWGLLQPYAHLNAGRLASGALAMPSNKNSINNSGQESALLTTCVGSCQELTNLTEKVSPLPLSCKALNALFYYMRCSQLEHGASIQELAYERAQVVLPPLVEWLRVSAAHAEHRYDQVIDHDDIAQAARLLLPGVDCPVRSICSEEISISSKRVDDSEYMRRCTLDMAFRLLMSTRLGLISQAMPLLPLATGINTANHRGLTALMIVCVEGNEPAVSALLNAGADVNVETPSSFETQHWTALTYTALIGHCNIARILLNRGASVEGGAKPDEERPTITPLQAATASGNDEMIALLLAHGAQPFLSTLVKDGYCYTGSTQRGCYSAISVATAHGQRSCLHQLISNPRNFSPKRNEEEILSLEEILAEGCGPQQSNTETELVFSKTQNKALQEAMYHGAESNYLDITMEFRSLNVAWTLHSWMHSLSAAHELRLDTIIEQLLRDFLQVCPDDYSTPFVQECLPLLFDIFRYGKKEETSLLLAEIFSTCYGREPIKQIRDSAVSNGSRIDPKFINNPELSDVQFRVENKVFYGHKIVLVTASGRFRNMLSAKLCEGNPPVVQINDIRYHIFQLVMEYLYNGGCETLEVSQSDILELMAAANFFQLDGLLRFCEARCSSMVDLDSIASMYIHAKVYNALQLLEYCQGFLLQNMVTLMTYDDSIKRLIFAKKLPNHDVLAGLLITLQARIKARKPQTQSKSLLRA